MSSEKETNKKVESWSVIKHFLAIFLPSAIIIGIVVLVFWYRGIRDDRANFEKAKFYQLGRVEKMLSMDFKSITSDLMFLTGMNKFQEFLNGTNSDALKALTDEYLLFCKEKRIYDQVRFLNEKGMEKARINYNKGKPYIVPEEQLQSKVKRYYFRETFKLEPREVFVSPFDLNIEKGEIEQPLKPVLRIGTPVFDKQGRKKGIILLNYLGKDLLDNFGHTTDNGLSQVMLLNSEGYLLKGPRVEDEWGFMYRDKKNSTLGNVFPEAWQKISRAESGIFYSEDGMFAFTTVYPLRPIRESSSYYWKVVFHVSQNTLNTESAKLLVPFLQLYAGFCLLLALSTWFLTKKRQKAEEEIIRQTKERLSLQMSLEKKETEIKLMHLDKMASLGTMVACVAHDINNPLTVAFGNMQLFKTHYARLKEFFNRFPKISLAPDSLKEIERLKKDMDLPSILEEVDEEYSCLKRALERIAEIVGSLRTGGRIDNTTIMEIDINESIESTLHLIPQSYKKNVEIKTEFGLLPKIFCTGKQMSQVFMNIIVNSLQAMNGKGALNIETLSDEKYIYIKFCDTGPGIPRDKIKQIFDPFYTTKPAGEGTGLGLSISHSIVEKHGGDITVDNNNGEGATFTVKLLKKKNK